MGTVSQGDTVGQNQGQLPGGRDISAEKLASQAGVGSGEDCGQQGIRCYYVTLL